MGATKKSNGYLLPILWIAVCLAFDAGGMRAQSSAVADPAHDSRPTNNNGPVVDSHAQPEAGYLIGPGDVLSINVWRENEISQKLVVRPDGMITLPLVGDVRATGLTPKLLSIVITKKLETVLTNPEVSVIVAEVHSKFYVVVGEVAKPGQYSFTRPTTVLEAISEAGGFKDFAKKNKVYVLHLENGKRIRIPFHYNDVVKGKDSGKDFELSAGDAIVVP
jgi:polysaccharide biosynthesis/export protein